MTILGIITCQVLELEIAHLLGCDPRVKGAVVLETAESRALAGMLEERKAFPLFRIPHLSSFRSEPSPGLTVLIRVLPFGLHRNRETLRGALRKNAREISRFADGLLLGYGRCGGALDDPGALLDVDVPVFSPRDAFGPVDDCVGMLLGGRAAYVAEQRRVPGTFFMTPGWATHWESMLEGGGGVAALRRMFAGYQRVLLVSTPPLSKSELQRRATPFCDLLGLPWESRTGTLDLLGDAWEKALCALSAIRPKGARQPGR